MREKLDKAGRWMLRHPAHVLAPVIGALLLLNWIVSEESRGPWPELLLFLVPVAVMVGIAPWVPVASLAIMLLLPLAQVAGLVVGPASQTWTVYLAVPLVGLILGAVAEGRVRRYVLVVGFVWSGFVAYLMAAPGPQGSWAQWNALYGRQNPHEQDFVLIAAVAFGLFLLLWGIGVLYRLALQGKFARIAALLSDERREETSPRPVHTTLSGLSPRELEIYALVARGLSNAEIASQEHISEATVKTHVSSILRKLELRSRTQLAAHANGLVPA